MKRLALIALSGLLLAGCAQSEGPLLPELNGRWISEDVTRVHLATTGSGAPLVATSTQDRCQRDYVTFDKYPMDLEFAGSVTLHRQGDSEVVFLVGSAARDGDRITMTGREPNDQRAVLGRKRIELVLRNGEVVFDDVFDHRGRSVRNDLSPFDNAPQTQRVSFNTIGDVFRATLDLKPCGE